MSIPVVCPHCDSKYQLQPELVGKSMRCPNPDCREIFVVAAAPPPPPPPPVDLNPPPAPVPWTETAVEFRLEPGGGEPTRIAPAEHTPPQADAFRIPSATELPYERIESESAVLVGKPDFSHHSLNPSPFSGQVPEGETVVYTRPPGPGSDPIKTAELVLPPPAKPAPAMPAPQAKPVPTAKPAAAKPAPAPLPPKAQVPVAERSPRAKPGPKEVAWSDAAPPPPPPNGRAATVPAPVPAPAPVDAEAVEPVEAFIRRRRKSPWRGVALMGLLFATIATVAAIGIGYLRHEASKEQREADEAKEFYEKGNFAAAATRFEQVAAAYPDGPDAERYKFFADLSAARAAVDAVTTRENPAPGQRKLGEFVAKYAASPLAQPGGGFGSDVIETGRKLADALADHAGDKLKAYRAASTDPEKFRPEQVATTDLDAAESAVTNGRTLLPTLDRFREKDGLNFADQRKKFDDLAAEFRKERDRLAALAPYRTLTDDPTDDRIETAEAAVRAAGLSGDPQAKEIFRIAKRRLQELIGYTVGVVDAKKSPGEVAAAVLFAAPVAGSPEPRPPLDAVPDVAFAVARGVLYALDSHTGTLLWGTRVAAVTADLRTADVPVRIDAGDGSEWVLVASDVGGKPALTARDARTGAAVWHQPLEAGFAGRPALVGRRAYVPLADPMGTIVELQLATGRRLGHLRIRQPIGAPPVAAAGPRVGTGFLYVPADARRVFVFEVGRETDAGDREPPRVVRVIGTGHPRDGLRGEPLLIASADGPGPKYLILPQTDGPAGMRLRCYTLPPPTDLVGNPAGGPPPDAIPVEKSADVAVAGWSWFPPVTDGERVVVATDAGAFAVFGVNQTGNVDRPLFPLPGPKPTADADDAVTRAVVVAADEDSAWAVLGGNLVRLRTAVDPAGGLRYVRHGNPRPVGEPTHRGQVRPAAGVGIVVVRTGPTSAARAVAFDLATGLPRWQTQLGAVAAASPLPLPDGTAVLIDTEGGVYTVPADGSVRGAVVAKPLADPAARARVAVAPDGKTAWVLVPEVTKDGRRLRVRRVEDGAVAADTSVLLPELPAGAPVVTNGAVLVPLADGTVYRLAADGGELKRGPVWRSAAGKPDAGCLVTVVGDGDFVTTDGATRATRWRWPADGVAVKVAGPWDTRSPIAAAPAAYRADATVRVALVETTGVVQLFDANKTDEPLNRWRPGKDSPVPPGPAGVRLTAVAAGDRQLLVYAVSGRRLVALDADHPQPAWMTWVSPDDGAELVGWAVRDGVIVTTDQSGRLTLVAVDTGRTLDAIPAPAGGFATVPAGLGRDRAAVALADGTVQSVPLKTGK